MLVEYLFNTSPINILLIVLTAIFLVSKSSKEPVKNVKKQYEQTLIEYQTLSKNNSNNEESILVMSYNILAYSFTNISWYSYVNPELLHPKYRSPRIINEIEQVKADIVCLQEVDYDLYNDFYKDNLYSLGYQSLIKPATNQRIVGNLIAYKTDVFKKESSEILCLNEGLDKLDESFVKHKDAMFVVLKHKVTGKRLLAINTHLYWKPEDEYIKYGQIAKIIKHIADAYGRDIPVIFCGDLNSTPNSNVFRYIYNEKPSFDSVVKGDSSKNKKFIDMFWETEKHGLDLRSAYDSYKKYNDKFTSVLESGENHPDFTVHTKDDSLMLDYIIYNSNKLKVTDLLKVPTQDPDIKLTKLPNSKYPSDHLKIAARFSFIN